MMSDSYKPNTCKIDSFTKLCIGSFNNKDGKDPVKFKEVNLFYGYNGSGKTTLTRIFSGLNTGATPPGYDDCNIAISCNSKPIKSFADSNLKDKVKVFNEDFIEQNLELKQGKAKGLAAVIGADNIKVKNQITELENKKAALFNEKNELKAEIQFNNAETKFNVLKKEIAGEIKSALHLDAHDYDIKKFTKDYYDYQKKSPIDTVTEKDKNDAAASFTAGTGSVIEDKYIKSLTDLKDNIPSWEKYEPIAEILQIPIKRKNVQLPEELINWIEEGTKLHRNKHDACQFCGQDIDAAVWSAREAQIKALLHKDPEFERLENKFYDIKKDLDNSNKAVEKFSCDLNERDFFTGANYQTYKQARTDFDNNFAIFKEELANLVKLTARKDWKKEEPILFDKEKIITAGNDLNNNITAVTETISKNNQDIADQEKTKEQKKKIVINYYIQQQIDSLKEAEADIAQRETSLAADEKLRQDIDKDITEKKNSLANQTQTINKLNELLSNSIDRELIFKFDDVTKEYCLQRKTADGNNMPATKLSEGERNLIAFLYFLVSCDSQEKKTEIIVVDDPVCSLDSNRLFLLQQLVVDILTQYGQVFFLSHNFYFFVKVRDALFAHLKSQQGKDKLEIFEIKNPNGQGSVIKPANKYIKEHISDYLALIENLKETYKSNNDEPNVTVGNTIRRVLEIFVSFKNTDKDKRLYHKMCSLTKNNPQYQSLINLAHAFSHSSEFTDIGGNHDFSYAAGKKEIELLFKFIQEKDPEHFKGFGCTKKEFEFIQEKDPGHFKGLE